MSNDNTAARPFTDDTRIGEAAAQQPLSGTAFVTGTMLVHGLGHGAQMSNENGGTPKKQTAG